MAATGYPINSGHSLIVCDYKQKANNGIFFVFDKLDKKRKEELDFHIRSGDYFGTLATIVYIIYQSQEQGVDQKKILRNIQLDLEYLQENYLIVKKF